MAEGDFVSFGHLLIVSVKTKKGKKNSITSLIEENNMKEKKDNRNGQLSKEEFESMLPPGYWKMPAPEKVGDRFFNTSTMEWDTIEKIETKTIPFNLKEEIKAGRVKINRKEALKYFSSLEDIKEVEKYFSDYDENS